MEVHRILHHRIHRHLLRTLLLGVGLHHTLLLEVVVRHIRRLLRVVVHLLVVRSYCRKLLRKTLFKKIGEGEYEKVFRSGQDCVIGWQAQ